MLRRRIRRWNMIRIVKNKTKNCKLKLCKERKDLSISFYLKLIKMNCINKTLLLTTFKLKLPMLKSKHWTVNMILPIRIRTSIAFKLSEMFLYNNIMFLRIKIIISVQKTNKLSIPLNTVIWKKKEIFQMRINTIINNFIKCNK